MLLTAEIVSIGDELLAGQRVNTNAARIASELAGAGIVVRRISVCADSVDEIGEQLRESLHRSGLVIVTGGLGPTRDDMTKQAVKQLLRRELVFDQGTYDRTLGRYSRLEESRLLLLRENAMVIGGSVVLENKRGLAPGMIIACGERFRHHTLVLLPGVPHEMAAMMHDSVVPYLSSKSGSRLVHSHIKTTGIGETALARIIREIEEHLPFTTSIAYLPHTAGVSLRISSVGTDEADVARDNRSVLEAVTEAAGEYIYATTDLSLEEVIGRLLVARGLKIATAESCTGGLISSRLTDIAGSSRYVDRGFVVYSNAAKEKLLGVKPRTLAAYGAVSEEVAAEMAEGCLVRSGVDVALSSTGVAGPDGGTENKPVGMVCLGLAVRRPDNSYEMRTVTEYFKGDRLQNKIRFSEAALRMLWKALKQTLV